MCRTCADLDNAIYTTVDLSSNVVGGESVGKRYRAAAYYQTCLLQMWSGSSTYQLGGTQLCAYRQSCRGSRTWPGGQLDHVGAVAAPGQLALTKNEVSGRPPSPEESLPFLLQLPFLEDVLHR